MNDSTEYATEAISAIRDKALLLVMANEYLCEEVFLTKMGKDIEKNISRLRDDISSLKKEYPGKFTVEIKTDDILDNMNNTAQSLIKPGGDVKDNCHSGKLGRELESSVKSIAEAVNQIRMQVTGSQVTYTKKDSMINMFDGLKGIGRSLGTTLGLAVKVLLCLIIIAMLAFGYLYFTMEKESTLLKNIATSQDNIKEKQDTLSRLESKMEEVSKEIEAIENEAMARSFFCASLRYLLQNLGLNHEF